MIFSPNLVTVREGLHCPWGSWSSLLFLPHSETRPQWQCYIDHNRTEIVRTRGTIMFRLTYVMWVNTFSWNSFHLVMAYGISNVSTINVAEIFESLLLSLLSVSGHCGTFTPSLCIYIWALWTFCYLQNRVNRVILSLSRKIHHISSSVLFDL